MSSKCILCDNGYDFRKIQVNEILGTVGIALASSLNSVTKSNAFKYCPVCGKKLTKDNFGGKNYFNKLINISLINISLIKLCLLR